MDESDHYGALWQGAKAEGWNLFRIADGSVGKKPADIAGISPSAIGVLIEVKLIKRRRPNWTDAYPHWPSYELHQQAWLAKYAEANAIAIAAEYDEASRRMLCFVLTLKHEFYIQHGPEHEVPYVIMEREPNQYRWIYTGWHRIEKLHRSLVGLCGSINPSIKPSTDSI